MSDAVAPRKSVLARVPTPLLIIIGTLTAIALAAVLSHLFRRPPAPPSEPPPVNVRVMTIRPEGKVADTMDLPAVVEPNRVVRVAAEVSGRVEKLHLDDGATVSRGDAILELNTDILRAEHDRAVAQQQFDKAEVERIGKLLTGGASTERQRDEAVARLSISAASAAQTKALLDRSRILAPISGVINRVSVEKGEYVQPGTIIADIVDTAVVKVAVDLPERNTPFIRLEDVGQVQAQVRGEMREFPGRVTFLSALADAQTRVSRCELTVDNRDGLLRCGQIVRVRLVRRTLDHAILAPLLSVIPMEEGKIVYVVEGDVARQRPVTLGLLRGRDVQITSGLEAGDRLIVAGHRFVGAGQRVKVVGEDGPDATVAASAATDPGAARAGN